MTYISVWQPPDDALLAASLRRPPPVPRRAKAGRKQGESCCCCCPRKLQRLTKTSSTTKSFEKVERRNKLNVFGWVVPLFLTFPALTRRSLWQLASATILLPAVFLTENRPHSLAFFSALYVFLLCAIGSAASFLAPATPYSSLLRLSYS